MQKYSEEEIKSISDSYKSLIQLVKDNMTAEQLAYVDKAYQLTLSKYNGKRMISGKPYMLHLIELANIAYSEIGLRSKSIVSAFLHGITYKSDFTLDMVREQFGNNIAVIVDGFNKVSNVQTEHVSYQSEQFRKLFLSLVEDIRVVLLKIIHRLYDLRHPEDVDSEMFPSYVNEVKYLYIPIVHRLGLYKLKQEMEEKVMKFENPVEYQEICDKIKVSNSEQEILMENFMNPIKASLEENNIETSIKWRKKSVPSIYAKMKAQNVPFEQVFDLFAIRIIIQNAKKNEEKYLCWQVYSLITNIYQPNPKRLRDWITTPKPSGYESLHTTVQAGKNWIEVQIRTERMDEIAEKGSAAHWQYKGKTKEQTTDEWLNQVRDILENPDQIVFDLPDDKLTQRYKTDKIFIITPNGDLKQLPVGSTVLDFAFDVHTQVGSQCTGAIVNGKLQPIRYVLSNGDRVEIITNKKQVPKTDWLNVVTTDKAKNKIKRYLKDLEMKEAELGNAIFHRKLKNWKINYTDKLLTLLLKEYGLNSGMELYHRIATNQIELMQMKSFIISVTEDKEVKNERDNEEIVKERPSSLTDEAVTIGKEYEGLAFKMAKCCNPIPGDEVFGFISIAGVITIHRNDCPNASALKKQYYYRIIDVKWQTEFSSSSQAMIKVVGKDDFGLLGVITNQIKDLGVNIINATFNTVNNQFEGILTLQISNTALLDQLIHKIRTIDDVVDVHRIN